MSHFLSEKNELDLEVAFAVMAATPTFEQASEQMLEHGITVSPQKLEVFARKYPEQFEAARDKIAPLLERATANDMLNATTLATIAENAAVSLAIRKLEDGKVAEPAKMARELADVKAKNIHGRLALQGRPTQITQDRSIDELTRALVAMKVAEVVEVTDAEVVEDKQIAEGASG